MDEPDMPPATPPQLIHAKNEIAYAAQALNVAIRKAAELDLDVQIETYIQGLEGAHLARHEGAPAVQVRVERYMDEGRGPD